MAETIREGCDGGGKWHWWAVQGDLVEQGGLGGDEIAIFPTLTHPHGCFGIYRNAHFHFTWVRDAFLVLTMQEHSQPLVDAFAAVLEYAPFARYGEEGRGITVEWDRRDPGGRFAALREIGEPNLERTQPEGTP